MTLPDIVAVVALARNGVIGSGGTMPWRLPSDLARFRLLTMGKPMIMGRRTFEAIGRVLDGRDTVVLTRNLASAVEGAHLAGTPDAAVALAAALAERRGASEIAIVGGAQTYALFLDRTVRILATEIDAEPAGDARFPPINALIFDVVSAGDWHHGEGDGAATRFVVYERRAQSLAALLVDAADAKLC